MRKTGFTLIELMIVIAILGIMVGSFSAPVSQFWRRLSDGRLEADRQEVIARGFHAFHRAFLESTKVTRVDDNSLVLEGSRWRRILREDFGNVLVLEGDGGFRARFDFAGGLILYGFSQVDSRAVWCRAKMGSAVFPMFWRCGK